MTVQILPGVSAIDVLINDIGVDVGLFGLPVLVLNLAAFGLAAPSDSSALDFGLLLRYLGRFYQPSQVLTLISADPAGGFAFGRAKLSDLLADAAPLAASTSFFIDAAKETPEVDREDA